MHDWHITGADAVTDVYRINHHTLRCGMVSPLTSTLLD